LSDLGLAGRIHGGGTDVTATAAVAPVVCCCCCYRSRPSAVLGVPPTFTLKLSSCHLRTEIRTCSRQRAVVIAVAPLLLLLPAAFLFEPLLRVGIRVESPTPRRGIVVFVVVVVVILEGQILPRVLPRPTHPL
ncbi:unnamed protein product, partial [Ectocarpus sp. 4 AP-2014]